MPERALRPPKLDARLEAALSLADRCDTCADIGADHGRLSAALLMRGAAKRALIADISDKALMKARARVERLRLGSQVVFAVADGLDALSALGGEHADTVFILGMGGETASGILRRGCHKLHGATLILSAQTDLPLLRQTVCEIGYRIRREVLAQESGRIYTLMKCLPAEQGEPAYTEEQLLLGPGLLDTLPPLWLPVLMRRKRLLAQGIAAMEAAGLQKDEARLSAFQRELSYVERAIGRCEEVSP